MIRFEGGTKPSSLDMMAARYIPLSDPEREEFDTDPIADGSDPGYIQGYQAALGRQPFRVWREAIAAINNCLIAGENCAVIPLKLGRPVWGSSLNWTPQLLSSARTEELISRATAPTTVTEAILLHAPGFRMFGHWLLDFVPRLLTIRRFIVRAGALPVLCRRMPPWAWPFIESVGLKDLIRQYPDDEALSVGKLYIPLMRKSGAVCSSSMLRESFRFLDERLGDPSGPVVARLIVARKRPPHAFNQDELLWRAVRAGYCIVSPETMALADQIAMFRQAHAIIGEDGSALHNIGFCRASPEVTMLTRGERSNYWHLSVAKAAGVKIRVVRSETRGGGYAIGDASMDSMFKAAAAASL